MIEGNDYNSFQGETNQREDELNSWKQIKTLQTLISRFKN